MAIEEIDDDFDDILTANEAYAAGFEHADLEARAAKGLGVLTCMDSRIDPLAMLGLAPGDAKILRNAGARVTDDVLRTLVLADHLLGVNRVMIVAHTNCRMASGTEDDVHAAIRATRWTRHPQHLVPHHRATRRPRCARTCSGSGRGPTSTTSPSAGSSTTWHRPPPPRLLPRRPQLTTFGRHSVAPGGVHAC